MTWLVENNLTDKTERLKKLQNRVPVYQRNQNANSFGKRKGDSDLSGLINQN